MVIAALPSAQGKANEAQTPGDDCFFSHVTLSKDVNHHQATASETKEGKDCYETHHWLRTAYGMLHHSNAPTVTPLCTAFPAQHTGILWVGLGPHPELPAWMWLAHQASTVESFPPNLSQIPEVMKSTDRYQKSWVILFHTTLFNEIHPLTGSIQSG